ncbi:hypothetical protein [Desulfosporosinus sp. HMP52]|nr:hypothetical protein [Desulfosporosinus sp. HMP52]
MDRPEPNSNVRRYIAYSNPFGITQLHLKNPYVIVVGRFFSLGQVVYC